MNPLEDRLLDDISKGKEASTEDALLIVSGVKTPQELNKYKRKLDNIQARFQTWLRAKGAVSDFIHKEYMSITRARFLFEYLWNSKPRRHGNGYLLTVAVDAQLDPDVNSTLGSCIGLTALYTVLCIRENIDTVILTNGDHVLNRLKHDGVSINVENTDPLGFDKEPINDSFEELPPVLLIASILNSRGIDEQKRGECKVALDTFSKAVTIRPDYENVYNNRGNVYFELGDYRRAQRDYEIAVKLKPDFAEACCNLGLALEKQADFDRALYYFKKALEISPQYEDAKRCLEILGKRRS